jgi:hypothetical protein
MYSSTLSVTSAIEGVGGQRHVPAALSPWKTRYPLYRRVGRLQSRSRRVRKISPQPGFDSRTVQLLANRYTDCAIPAHVQTKGTKNKFFLLHAMIAYREGRSIALPTFTISDGCRSSSRSGHFTPGKITTSTNYVGSCGLRSRSGPFGEERVLCPAGTQPSFLGRWANSWVTVANTQFQLRSTDKHHRSDPELNSLNGFQCISQTCSKRTLQTTWYLFN